MCLRIVSTKCVNRMKARAIRPLCWPPPNKFISIRESVRVYGNGYKGNTTQHNVEKVYNNSYKGEEITLTTFSTLWLRAKQIQEFTTKPSCFIFFINALQRLRGVNEIFVWKSFAFPLFQLVENMILCKSGKY